MRTAKPYNQGSLQKLKKFLLTHCFFMFLLSPVSWGDEFQKGFAAYENKDYAAAITIFKALAQQGHGNALLTLGHMLYLGEGVEQDRTAAVGLYKLAADKGIPMAQLRIGITFYTGDILPQNYPAAAKYLTLAAEQGNSAAQAMLGSLYFLGEGVLKDDVAAYMWMNIAASLGNDEASTNRDLIAKEMTPNQVAEAQRLARECVSKEYRGC